MRITCPACGILMQVPSLVLSAGENRLVCEACNGLISIRIAREETQSGPAPAETAAPAASDPGARDEELASLRNLYQTGKVRLSPLPEILQKIRTAIDEPNAQSDRIGALCSQDPVLAGRALKIANSSLYGSAQRIVRLDHAFGRIGLRGIRSILFAMLDFSLQHTLPPPLVEMTRRTWFHGLSVAIAARQIAIRAGLKEPESIFFIGLFHDIGRMAALQAIPFLPRPIPPAKIEEYLDRVHEKIVSDAGIFSDLEAPDEVWKIAARHHDLSTEEVADARLAAFLLAEHIAAVVFPTARKDVPGIPPDILVGILNLNEIAQVDVGLELEAGARDFQALIGEAP